MILEPLTWEATFALAEALHRAHPDVDLQTVSLGQIHAWILALPNFEDDQALVNDDILMDVYREWLEITLEEQG